jgi:hypothetical protein
MQVNTTTNPAVRERACPLCDAAPGEACSPKPEGDHLARFLDAYTAGQLTKAYMAMTLAELVVIDSCSVIPAQRPAPDFRVTYVPDTVLDGWWADLRGPDGYLVENGWGPTRAEALAKLERRCGSTR